MVFELITIMTKRKITKKQDLKIFEALIDILGDKNLLTTGGSPITFEQHRKIWEIIHDKKL
jgi:hypothetical protein